MHDLIVIWMEWVKAWEYLGVVILMAMESSIIPVPSEIVVPPAAIAATFPDATMSFWGVVIAGTVGSYLGSCVMYFMALFLGRPFVYRFGKYFLMPPHKVEKAEVFMNKYSTAGIFFARFLPVIRHLISIPAGLVKMNFTSFSLATIIGSAIWCWVLAWFGDKVGSEHPDIMKSPEDLVHAVKDESHLVVLAIVMLAALYAIMKYMTRNKK